LGKVALWVLVVGFIGMTLWRLSEAIWPTGEGRKAGQRALALAKAVLYAVIAYGVLKYALGLGAPQSSNSQSVDLTATLMRYTGGKALVVVIGLVLIGAGLYLGYQAWRERFRRDMDLGRLSPRTRKTVEWLGRAGGVARGVVFITAGIFLVVAAVEAKPQQAKGIDSSLRALTATPAGPWLLALVAIGLVMFGLFSCCEARLRRF
jgi:type IV secretory pathway VirB2 component (pilin)